MLLSTSAYFILTDLFGERGTETFEQLNSVGKIHGQEMGMNSGKMTLILETASIDIHLIPEPRVFELLQSAGFGNIVRFYTALWYGGWIATKN